MLTSYNTLVVVAGVAAVGFAAGVVGEVLPPDRVLDRAMEIARVFADKPDLALRYSRVVLTQRFKRLMAEGLSLGLGLEALAAIDLLGRMKQE